MSSASTAKPALAPPYGTYPNFIDPASLLKWNNLCIAACLSIASVVFFLRTYVRIAIKREWILEDYLVCISWSGLVTYCALMTATMHKHGGIHAWDVTLPQAHEAIYWFNVTSIEYAPIILCTKLAILLLYRRVFLPHKCGLFDWCLRIFMAILIGFYTATTIVKIWECTPRQKIWDKSVPGKCIDVPSLLNTSGLFNTITDAMILLVPVKTVWNLQMNTRSKFAVAAIFTVGFCAPVFSLIGFIVRMKVSASLDVTWHDPEILLWAAAEVTMGLICVCIPTLAPLIRRRAPVRPSDSILNGKYLSRHVHLSGLKKSIRSLEEQELWSNGDLELQPTRNDSTGGVLKVPPTAATVTTGIQGGIHEDEEKGHAGINMPQADQTGSSEGIEELSTATGIVTTVRMEHSYV